MGVSNTDPAPAASGHKEPATAKATGQALNPLDRKTQHVEEDLTRIPSPMEMMQIVHGQDMPEDMRQLMDEVQGAKPELTTKDSPAAPRMIGRVQDLEVQVMQQNAHILLLHRIVEQMEEQVNVLRDQFGLELWRPQIRVEDNS